MIPLNRFDVFQRVMQNYLLLKAVSKPGAGHPISLTNRNRWVKKEKKDVNYEGALKSHPQRENAQTLIPR